MDSEGNPSSGTGITVYIPASSTSVTFISNSSGSALNSTLAGDLSNYYILGTDVDLDGVTWTPVGDNTTSFTGTFDGGVHTISNLTISASTTDYQGLFGYVDGRTLANAVLENALVTGRNYVGSLAGWIDSTIVTNSHASGSVNGADADGLVGHTENVSTVSDCHSSATVAAVSLLILLGVGFLAGLQPV